jgi:hypothetical protein
MTKVGAAFRDAWQDYRRHFHELWIASALLSLPMTVVAFLRWLAVTHAHLPFSALSAGTLGFVDSILRALTPAAVALLAADLRAGGTWGWRQAWARALSRIEPIASGRWVASFVLIATTMAVFLVLLHLRRVLDARLWQVVAVLVVAPLVLVGNGIERLVPLVTSIERTGGGDAVGRAWSLLSRDLRRNPTVLFLAELVVFLPVLILLSIVLPRDEWLPWFALFSSVYELTVRPLVTLVALSVYCDARQLTTGQLRAELDAR